MAAQVILNQWYNRFYNTLQDRDWNAFVSAIVFFCVLAAIYTVLAVYQTYLNQWLQIRWRSWMTQTYMRQWLDAANHYRMQLLGIPPTIRTSASPTTCGCSWTTR